MKTYLIELLPKIPKFSKKLDDLSLLTNQHWTLFDEEKDNKVVYIFRDNNQLLISTGGRVEKATWEYLGNNSLLIDKKTESYLFKHSFLDQKVLILKIDGKKEYAFFFNEEKFLRELTSLKDITSYLIDNYQSKNNHGEQRKLKGKKYFIEINNKPEFVGPFRTSEIKKRVNLGEISPSNVLKLAKRQSYGALKREVSNMKVKDIL